MSEHKVEHSIIGLKVNTSKDDSGSVFSTVDVRELLDWITSRDAACAEYLAPALRKHLETGEDVDD